MKPVWHFIFCLVLGGSNQHLGNEGRENLLASLKSGQKLILAKNSEIPVFTIYLEFKVYIYIFF